jgi:hypothetical protein
VEISQLAKGLQDNLGLSLTNVVNQNKPKFEATNVSADCKKRRNENEALAKEIASCYHSLTVDPEAWRRKKAEISGQSSRHAGIRDREKENSIEKFDLENAFLLELKAKAKLGAA